MFEAIKNHWIIFRRDKRGVTAVEYAVIAGVVVVGVGAAFSPLMVTLLTWSQNITF